MDVRTKDEEKDNWNLPLVWWSSTELRWKYRLDCTATEEGKSKILEESNIEYDLFDSRQKVKEWNEKEIKPVFIKSLYKIPKCKKIQQINWRN